MGCLLTEGDHLYLDRGADWQGALELLLVEVAAASEACDADRVVLRDLPADFPELDAALRESGFVPIELPASMVLEMDWKDWDELLARLSYRARRFQRRSVAPHDGSFEVELLHHGGRAPTDEEWKHLYGLYQNVKERSFDLNTFPLPESFFRTLLEDPCWEILTLTLRPECGGKPEALPQAFVACYVGPEQFVPVVPGLDYRAVDGQGAYRQLIRAVIERARERGAERVLFGMGAELEKERFGAVGVKRLLYIQSGDHYQHDVLSLLAAEAASGEQAGA